MVWIESGSGVWPGQTLAGRTFCGGGHERCRSKPVVAGLIFGGAGDVDLAEKIAGDIRARHRQNAPLNLAGRTSLRELAAALKICDLRTDQ